MQKQFSHSVIIFNSTNNDLSNLFVIYLFISKTIYESNNIFNFIMFKPNQKNTVIFKIVYFTLFIVLFD